MFYLDHINNKHLINLIDKFYYLDKITTRNMIRFISKIHFIFYFKFIKLSYTHKQQELVILLFNSAYILKA